MGVAVPELKQCVPARGAPPPPRARAFAPPISPAIVRRVVASFDFMSFRVQNSLAARPPTRPLIPPSIPQVHGQEASAEAQRQPRRRRRPPRVRPVLEPRPGRVRGRQHLGQGAARDGRRQRELDQRPGGARAHPRGREEDAVSGERRVGTGGRSIACDAQIDNYLALQNTSNRIVGDPPRRRASDATIDRSLLPLLPLLLRRRRRLRRRRLRAVLLPHRAVIQPPVHAERARVHRRRRRRRRLSGPTRRRRRRRPVLADRRHAPDPARAQQVRLPDALPRLHEPGGALGSLELPRELRLFLRLVLLLAVPQLLAPLLDAPRRPLGLLRGLVDRGERGASHARGRALDVLRGDGHRAHRGRHVPTHRAAHGGDLAALGSRGARGDAARARGQRELRPHPRLRRRVVAAFLSNHLRDHLARRGRAHAHV
eukprot:29142-Pelagococcus_subviridis.AAC.5